MICTQQRIPVLLVGDNKDRRCWQGGWGMTICQHVKGPTHDRTLS
jgi:hypothetical protein